MTFVSDSILKEIPDFRAALRACQMMSGKQLKEIAFLLDIEASHLSKMLSAGDDCRHFPTEKITQFMEICDNTLPLQWLLLRMGFGSLREITDLRAEIARLKQDLADAKTDNRLVLNVFKNFEAGADDEQPTTDFAGAAAHERAAGKTAGKTGAGCGRPGAGVV